MHGLAVSPRRAVCGSELLCLTSQEEDTSARQARSHDRKARCSSRSRFCLRVGFPFRARTNVAMHRMRLADSSLLTISAHFVNFCLSWNIVKVSQISLLYNTREHPITKPQGASEHGTGSQTEAATGPGEEPPSVSARRRVETAQGLSCRSRRLADTIYLHEHGMLVCDSTCMVCSASCSAKGTTWRCGHSAPIHRSDGWCDLFTL